MTSQASTTQVSAQAASQLYAPPGLKVEQPQSHIPNYPNSNSQANQNPPQTQMLPQQTQQQQAPTSTTTQAIPQINNSQGISGFVSGTNQQQQQQHQSHQPQRTYPPSSHFPPVQHYQHNSIQQSQHSSEFWGIYVRECPLNA